MDSTEGLRESSIYSGKTAERKAEAEAFVLLWMSKRTHRGPGVPGPPPHGAAGEPALPTP